MINNVFLAFLMLSFPLQGAEPPVISIIPEPVEMQIGHGYFRLDRETEIIADEQTLGAAATFNA